MSDDFEETYFDEPEAAPRRPADTKRQPNGLAKNRLAWLIAAIVVVIAILVVVYFAAIRNTSSNKTATGPTTNQTLGQYKVTYPKSWAPVDPNSVARGQHAFAAFRQSTGKGVVVMRLEGPVKTIDRAYVNSLRAELRRTVPDFRFQSSQVIPLHNGQALDFTYERTTLNQVRNVVVLPLRGVSIVIATIAPAGDRAMTTQINEIVSSFQLSS